ncbi:NADH-ubiquinone oxidoreductase 20.8 kDa subunit [Serendipita indica DSM 11827]|nr:NADH-ubiquinone oxidoreductase 20.8 kDa subunit [Serendipita indica DSM 11827]
MSHYGVPDRGTPYNNPVPMPKHVPPVDEIGATSAPLKSASFFIGAKCKEFNEDFMLCKSQNKPEQCLLEGRRVTRCAADLLEKMRAACAQEFEAHWKCLDNNNQEFYPCRKEERPLNACMFTKLGLSKTIPGTPKGQLPIHEVKNPIYKAQQK